MNKVLIFYFLIIGGKMEIINNITKTSLFRKIIKNIGISFGLAALVFCFGYAGYLIKGLIGMSFGGIAAITLIKVASLKIEE